MSKPDPHPSWECQSCISREEFETVAKQVAEIHGFLTGIATALKSPMLAAMLPPNLRNMLP